MESGGSNLTGRQVLKVSVNIKSHVNKMAPLTGCDKKGTSTCGPAPQTQNPHLTTRKTPFEGLAMRYLTSTPQNSPGKNKESLRN